MTIECAHEPEKSRYTLTVDGQLACVIDYRPSAHALSLTRTFTVPSYRGQGLAAKLVEWAVDDISQHEGRKIVPTCWYVSDWFDAHPERADLLSR